ncbi:zinc ribbon domain-containing protein [Fictibacillus enclensis]|uniref:zinc ribbon domain-containing protein n=1 Tax=Fictibacillus enclensis TaxID=1017270 RepID=UPI003CD0DC2A
MGVVEDKIREKFKCVKCGHGRCKTKELAMTGSGLSKLLDLQHNHFLFVSCENCGYVEVYNPSILEGKKGQLGTILDLFFG